MRVPLFLVAGVAAVLPHATMAAEPPMFDSRPLSDDELADARGGFSLGGAQIDFGAMVTTSLDGIRLLQTQLRINSEGVSASVASAPGITVTIDGIQPTVSQLAANQSDGTATSEGGGISMTIEPGSKGTSDPGAGYLTTSFQLEDLVVRHSIGRQISSFVENTANDRIVDTQVTVNLRLDNVEPLTLGSAGFQVQNLGLEAAMLRAP